MLLDLLSEGDEFAHRFFGKDPSDVIACFSAVVITSTSTKHLIIPGSVENQIVMSTPVTLVVATAAEDNVPSVFAKKEVVATEKVRHSRVAAWVYLRSDLQSSSNIALGSIDWGQSIYNVGADC